MRINTMFGILTQSSSNNNTGMQMRRGKEQNYTWTHRKSTHSEAQTLAAKIYYFPFINISRVCRYPKQIKHNGRKAQISWVSLCFGVIFFHSSKDETKAHCVRACTIFLLLKHLSVVFSIGYVTNSVAFEHENIFIHMNFEIQIRNTCSACLVLLTTKINIHRTIIECQLHRKPSLILYK